MNLVDLTVYGLVVGLFLHIADDAQGNRESIGVLLLHVLGCGLALYGVVLSHQGQHAVQGRIFHRSVVYKDVFLQTDVAGLVAPRAVLAFDNDCQHGQEALGIIQHQTFVAVLAVDHRFALLEYYRVVLAHGAVGNPVVCAVVEDDTIDQTLDQAGTFVVVRSHHASHGCGHIHIQCAGKERTARTEAQLGRDERTLHCAEGRRFAHKPLG